MISVTNQKGGVGKTTTSLNLGAALSMAGKRVLLIDADPQGNLTSALGYVSASLDNTLAKLILSAIDAPEDLEARLSRSTLRTKSGVDLIAANKRLSDAAASQYGSVNDAERPCEKVLDGVIEPLKDRYDYIVIDCGLKDELLTINALSASDYCIIPVQAHFLASEGIPEVLGMVRTVQTRFNPNLKIAGILLTMYQSRPQLCQNVRSGVAEVYGTNFHVFEYPIEYTIKIAECPAVGKSIFDYAPKNPAAESYRNLAREVMGLVDA